MKRIGSLLLALGVFFGSVGVPDGSAIAAGGTSVVAPQLTAGSYFSAGLASDGTVWIWGDARSGQLGSGQTSSISRPAQVHGLTGVKAIGAGYFTSYAVLEDGTVQAWGAGGSGQIGDGDTEDRKVPVAVSGLRDIVAIASGSGFHELAADASGNVWAWGNNDSGQLGADADIVDQSSVPMLVNGVSDVSAVATGGSFSLALTNSGEVWSWGWNKQGQLGDGTPGQMRWTPAKIPGLSGIVAIAAGYNNGVALDRDGNVWGWGQNTNGAIGDGTYTERRSPVKIGGVDHVVSIAAGHFHTLAIKADGTLWAWGLNNYNQLGDGTGDKKNEPVQVPGLSGIAATAAGPFHSHAVDRYGNGWSWGYNAYGSLGDGSTQSRSLPVQNMAKFDLTAPQLTNGTLTVTDIMATGLTLRWTKASDNATPQNEIKYIPYVSSTGNIDTPARAIANGMPLGGALTDADSFAATGLQPGKTYYFNVIAVDANGNRSAYAMQRATIASETNYSLAYFGNGNDGGSAPTDDRSYAVGDSAAVQGNVGLLFKTGFVFAGWNTSEDGNGTTYLPGTRVTFDGTADIKLYARWLPDTPADATPPQAVSFAPGNGASGVSVGTTLSIAFDEPIAGVAGKRIAIVRASDDAVFATLDASDAASVNVTGSIATVALAAPLAYGTTYRVEIDAGAFQDAFGNEYAGSGSAWTFATEDQGAGPLLAGLAVSSDSAVQPLQPGFDGSRTDYALSVPYGISSLSVTASVYEADSEMTVSLYDGSNRLAFGPFPLRDKQSSGALPIPVGNSRIDVTAAAPDGASRTYRIMVDRASAPTAPSGNPTTDGNETGSRNERTSVSVNGRTFEAATLTATNTNGRAGLLVDVDSDKLLASLIGEGSAPRVMIDVDRAADETTLRLTGDALTALAGKSAVVELRTPDGGYRLPTAEFGNDRLAKLFGSSAPTADIVVRLTISHGGKETLAQLRDASAKAGFLTVAQPLTFEITASYRDRSVAVDLFGRFVEREIALPDWLSPSYATTALVLDSDGTERPVPTRIVARGDRTFAVVSSMTNSTYVVVHNRVDFPDLAGHWAHDAVSDMASRMVVTGSPDGRFRPDGSVTRAEFAAMLVRALGLPSARAQASDASFADVHAGDWYAGALNAALQAGLVGQPAAPGGSFRPNAAITREEAAAMLAQAMKLTGMSAKPGVSDGAGVLASFKDAAHIGIASRSAVAIAVSGGLMKGDGGAFRPSGGLTRAEAATVVRRLLAQSGLID